MAYFTSSIRYNISLHTPTPSYVISMMLWCYSLAYIQRQMFVREVLNHMFKCWITWCVEAKKMILKYIWYINCETIIMAWHFDNKLDTTWTLDTWQREEGHCFTQASQIGFSRKHRSMIWYSEEVLQGTHLKTYPTLAGTPEQKNG